MKINIKLFLTCLILFVALHVTAQEKADMFNPVNTSVTSQTIAPDARAGGMGDVGAATEADVNSQYWNPAKYPFAISRAGVAINFTLGSVSSSTISTSVMWQATIVSVTIRLCPVP